MDLRKLKHQPSVSIAMTPFPYCVDTDDPLSQARDLMEEHDIRHVPVKSGGELVGLVTLRDLANATADSEAALVGDVCLTEAFTVDLHEPLDQVAARMADLHVGSALVLRNGELCGIFTAVDACRVLGEVVHSYFQQRPPDESA